MISLVLFFVGNEKSFRGQQFTSIASEREISIRFHRLYVVRARVTDDVYEVERRNDMLCAADGECICIRMVLQRMTEFVQFKFSLRLSVGRSVGRSDKRERRVNNYIVKYVSSDLSREKEYSRDARKSMKRERERRTRSRRERKRNDGKIADLGQYTLIVISRWC